MTNKNLYCLLVFFTLLYVAPIQSQQSKVGKIAIYPFHAIGVDDISVKSAESIFRIEVSRLSILDIVSEKRTVSTITDEFEFNKEFAIQTGKKLNTTMIVLCQLSSLGEKIIVQYMLFDVNQNKIIIQDRLTALFIEDLDTVMKRMAMSIIEQEPFQKTAEVGIITEQEAQIPLKRGANKFAGFSFGYLFPLSGYDNSDRSFAMDFRAGSEFEDFSVGMQLFIRKGFGVNIFSSYLLSKKDVCPYIGGGLGFHWVRHQNYYYNYDESDEDKKGDGFEVILNMGLRFFHTYNFQILINGAISITLNDYKDKGFIFTIGLIH